jgi:hypothetical protein
MRRRAHHSGPSPRRLTLTFCSACSARMRSRTLANWRAPPSVEDAAGDVPGSVGRGNAGAESRGSVTPFGPMTCDTSRRSRGRWPSCRLERIADYLACSTIRLTTTYARVRPHDDFDAPLSERFHAIASGKTIGFNGQSASCGRLRCFATSAAPQHRKPEETCLTRHQRSPFTRHDLRVFLEGLLPPFCSEDLTRGPA